MSLLLWFSILTLKINYTCEGGNAHLTRIPGFQKHICCYPLNYHCKVCEVDFTTFLKLFSWTNDTFDFCDLPLLHDLVFLITVIKQLNQEATTDNCHDSSYSLLSKGFLPCNLLGLIFQRILQPNRSENHSTYYRVF